MESKFVHEWLKETSSAKKSVLQQKVAQIT